MGVKRWILVLFIIAVVVSLLALLFMQSGVDEQIVEGMLPKVEERLGVEVEFEEVDVSLSSVRFSEVRILPVGGERPFALIKSLGVGVKVGPLLLGTLDLTGIRLDGLEVRMGQPSDGANPQQWRELIGRMRAGGTGNGKVSGGSSLPEVNLVSGRLAADDGRFSVTVEGISGRMSLENGAFLTTDEITLSGAGKGLLQGESSEFNYRPDGDRVTLDLERPEFEVAMDSKALEGLAGDIKTSVQAFLSEVPEGEPGGDAGTELRVADGGPGDSGDDSGLSVKLSFRDAKGLLISSAKDEKVRLNSVSGEMTVSSGGFTTRVQGGFHGTDARWTMGADWERGKSPRIALEVPDMPLVRFGPMFLDSEHVDWSKAFADGNLEARIESGAEKVEFEGQITVSGVTLKHPRLAQKPLSALDAHLDFKVLWERAEKRFLLERMLISRRLARATLRGTISMERKAFDLSLNVPPTACRQVLAAVPPQLRDEVDGVQLDGQFGMDLRVGVDEERPKDTTLDISLDNRCGITDLGSMPEPEQFRRPFSYRAYSESGQELRLISGPGTDRWTPYSMISPYVVEAALTTEDGKFRFHKGATVPEMRRAIELNLSKDGLSHGASTITMQLAKNLFLSRERTVARKLQELFFSWYLETYFTKDEILELYLNVIEFGPSLYGITEAADHYFGRKPHELNLVESVFLIKLLPNPVLRHGTYVRGHASERKLASLRRVMRTMMVRGRITKEELADGAQQTLEFYHEGDPLPEPRMPISRGGIRVVPQDDEYGEEYEGDAPSSEPEWGVPLPVQ